MIEFRVGGSPARIYRPLRDAAPTPSGWGELFIIREGRFVDDLKAVLAIAERMTSQSFEVFRANTGRPHHFTLPGAFSPIPVVFHAEQVGAVGLLSLAGWSWLLRDGVDATDLGRRIALRVLADHCLCLGRPDVALSAFARARDGLPTLGFFDGSRRILPIAEIEVQEQATYLREQDVTLVFQGLAHEFAHHAGPALRAEAEATGLVSERALNDAIGLTLELFEEGRQDLPVPTDLAGREEEVIQDVKRAVEALQLHLPSEMREEIVVDLIAASILWECCKLPDAARERAFSAFAAQMIMSSAALTLTHLVQLMSKRFSSGALDPDAVMSLLLLFGLRQNALLRLLLDTSVPAPWLATERERVSEEERRMIAGALMTTKHLIAGHLQCDELAKAPDFVTGAPTHRPVDCEPCGLDADTLAFLRLADDLAIRDEALDALRARRRGSAYFTGSSTLT